MAVPRYSAGVSPGLWERGSRGHTWAVTARQKELPALRGGVADCWKSGRAGGWFFFFFFFFLKPFSKMERRNDFHDNNSIRERNEGSRRGNLKGRCHRGEPGGGLGESGGGPGTIKTLKHKSLDYCS